MREVSLLPPMLLPADDDRLDHVLVEGVEGGGVRVDSNVTIGVLVGYGLKHALELRRGSSRNHLEFTHVHLLSEAGLPACTDNGYKARVCPYLYYIIHKHNSQCCSRTSVLIH